MRTAIPSPAWLTAGATLLAAACGASPSPGSSEVGPEASAPLTDRDPPSWTPQPAETPETGRAVGVATAGGYEQARAVALRVLTAVRDADEATLERYLADPIGRVHPRLESPSRPQSEVIQSVLQQHRRRGLGPDIPMEDLVQVDEIGVAPLLQEVDGESLPAGLSGSDLRVTIPLGTRGQQHFRLLLRWPAEGVMVVRPGPEPRVIAL